VLLSTATITLLVGNPTTTTTTTTTSVTVTTLTHHSLTHHPTTHHRTVPHECCQVHECRERSKTLASATALAAAAVAEAKQQRLATNEEHKAPAAAAAAATPGSSSGTGTSGGGSGSDEFFYEMSGGFAHPKEVTALAVLAPLGLGAIAGDLRRDLNVETAQVKRRGDGDTCAHAKKRMKNTRIAVALPVTFINVC